jgi:hypothetical protein
MSEIKIELRGFGTNADTSDNVIGELDITSSEDFPLSLTLQNFDIRQFGSRGGSFSKTFDIPATNNNNIVLNNLWKRGYVSSTKNVLGDIPAVIYADNIPIVSGSLKITRINSGKETLSYSCSFLGDNMDWASKIKDLELKDLKFSSSSYTSYPPANPTGYTYANVQGLSGNARDHEQYQLNRDKLHYPLMSLGEGLSNRNQVTDADFVPCVYLKNVWDKIFQAQGYDVESTFCDSDFFKSLIIPFEFENKGEQTNFKYGKIERSDGYIELHSYWPSQTAESTYALGDPTNTNNFGQITAATPSSAVGQKQRFAFFGNDILDDADVPASNSTGNVQQGTSGRNTMVVKNHNGSATVSANITARFYRNSGGNNYGADCAVIGELWIVPDDDDMAFYDALDNGSATAPYNGYERIWAQSQYINESSYYDIELNWTASVQLPDAPTTKVIFTMFFNDSPMSNGGSSHFGWKSGTLEISGATEISIGDDLSDIQFYLPRGKQSDFVSGVAQMFNLQFHTDPLEKKVYIEPYDYFYQRNITNDWTDKIDYSKGISEEFMHEIKSNIIFKYKDASGDGFIERYNKKNMTDWGSYKESNEDGSFLQGDYVVENKFFAPTFNWYEPEYIDQAAGHSLARTPCIPIIHSKYSHLETTNFTNIKRADKAFNIGARVLLTLPVEDGNLSYASSNSDTDLWTGYSYNTSGALNASNAFQFDFCRANFIHFDNARGTDQLIYDGWPGNDAANGESELQKLSIGSYSNSALNIPTGEVFIQPNLSFNDVIYSHEQEDWNGNGSNYAHSSGLYLMNGLFYNFYGRMVEQLKQKPRIKTVYLNLEYTDILTLDFRDLVYLDGIYYRINKIIDYKPHLNQSTKVELMEFFDLGKKNNLGDPMVVGDELNM